MKRVQTYYNKSAKCILIHDINTPVFEEGYGDGVVPRIVIGDYGINGWSDGPNIYCHDTPTWFQKDVVNKCWYDEETGRLF